MTRTEAREAFKAGIPVTLDGIEYLCISAVIYRRGRKGGFYMSVELLDRNRRAIVVARPERVRAAV